MPISNQRDYILKTEYSHHTTVALTQAVANAASADYSVNVALTTKYNNVSNATVGGKTTGKIGQATSTQN